MPVHFAVDHGKLRNDAVQFCRFGKDGCKPFQRRHALPDLHAETVQDIDDRRRIFFCKRKASEELRAIRGAHPTVQHFEILCGNIDGIAPDRGKPRNNAFAFRALLIKIAARKAEPGELDKAFLIRQGGNRFADLFACGKHVCTPLPQQLNFIHNTSVTDVSYSIKHYNR